MDENLEFHIKVNELNHTAGPGARCVKFLLLLLFFLIDFLIDHRFLFNWVGFAARSPILKYTWIRSETCWMVSVRLTLIALNYSSLTILK